MHFLWCHFIYAVRMENITITFADGSTSTVPQGTMLSAVIAELKIKKPPVAAKLDGELVDLQTPVQRDSHVSLLDAETQEGLEIYRHSASHIMAQAVKKLYPEVMVTIGPAIEDGFYYDFDTPEPFTPEDLKRIENSMQEIIKQNLPFTRRVLTKVEAINLFKAREEDYKVELIEEIPADSVSLYQQGDFIDLCRGPHVPSTGAIKAFKLTGSAGAYWRGDERNKMLQRIYGTAFADKKALKEYLNRVAEAKKRDHRKLGKQLDLFSIYEEAGAGLVVYHPKGALLRRILEDFEIKEHVKRGYLLVKGPQILKLDLWEKSGHLDNYRENMYFTEVEGKKYGLKPMNCLAHMLIYKSGLRSYKDLPLRYFELGTVNRHEKSGVLHGLARVREFTQDDAHILCTPDQLHQEIAGIIHFVVDVMNIFGFEFEIELSTRPQKSIGNDEDWSRALSALRSALDSFNFTYDINEGEGAFYGPKIDFKLRDCLKRSWQCATIQCDFVLPERFDLTYVGDDNEKHRPVMLHRVILGSIERFLGVLIEHYAGAFPLWLAPVQVKILTISEQQNDYAQTVVHKLLCENDIRTELDIRNESLGLKIREAQMQKIPYMLVIGNKEMQEHGVSPRLRSGENVGFMKIDDFIEKISHTCKEELQGIDTDSKPSTTR